MGKASDVDGSVQGATWDASTEAVSSGTDAGVVASADSYFSDFQSIGAEKGVGSRHGRDLGGVAADKPKQGENAEDGEQKRHAIHIAGWRLTVKGFREESFSSPKGTCYKVRCLWGFSKWGVCLWLGI